MNSLSPGLKNIAVILIYILAIILFVSLLSFFSAIKPKKFYSSETPENLGLKYENVEFKTSDNIKIKGWFIPTNHSKATIIVGHGYPFDKGNVLPVVQFLNNHYNLLLFDFRSFGGSEGSVSTIGYKEQKDVLAAIKYLKTRKDINHSRIGCWGISLSASTFIMAAAKTKDIKAIVADSAYANLDNMVEQTYKFFFFFKKPFVFTTKQVAKVVLGIDPAKVSPVDDIKKLDIPVFIIHGKRDSQIPFENSQMLYDAANEPKKLWLVEGADHCQAHAAENKKYEKEVMEFFDKYLK